MAHKKKFISTGTTFLLVFLGIGLSVALKASWLAKFDESITQMIRSIRPAFDHLSIAYTQLGSPFVIAVLYLVVLSFLLRKQLYAAVAWLSINVLGVAAIGNSLIKVLVQRERPSIHHLVTETSYSFPSGHSTGSVMFYGTLIFLLPLLIRKPLTRKITSIALVAVIFFIGLSRIYLGVHFPSDVLGGFSLGAGWLCLTYPFYKMYEIKGKKEDL